MKLRHISTVDRVLRLELGYASDIGPAGLTDAVVEALTKGGVLEEANIFYIRASAPGKELVSIDLWVPESEVVLEEPPPKPEAPFPDEPKPNV